MATYNKRGYKAPKEKEEKVDANFIEDTPNVDAKDSATAKAFDALDETASKTEEWVAKNQKYIMGVIAAAALVTIGYLSYQKFIVEPKEEEATTDLFVAQTNFQLATDATDVKKQDSLYTLVLKGSEGKQGAIGIADQYSGTDSGNIANYYAGIASLNLKKYDDAISYLEKFSSKDIFLSAIATGAIGDAYSQKNDAKKALEMYEKAAHQSANEFTTPRYLFKAGQTSLALGNKADALKYFTEIKEKYESTPEAQNIDALIGMAQ
jgi:tetratricopeptide (TPR) repeat protein